MIASEVEPLTFVLEETGKPHGYACPTCKKTYTSAYDNAGEKEMRSVKEAAQRCCAERECEDCGKISGDKKYFYMYCVECRAKREAERDAARFEKAEKVELSNYNGEFLCWEEHYYNDVWELYDQCHENTEEGEDVEYPTYVWACAPVKFTIDADGIVENALEDHHEDAYDRIGDKEVKDLQVFIDGWCEQQGILSYEEDTSVAVLIPPPSKEYLGESEDSEAEGPKT